MVSRILAILGSKFAIGRSRSKFLLAVKLAWIREQQTGPGQQNVDHFCGFMKQEFQNLRREKLKLIDLLV